MFFDDRQVNVDAAIEAGLDGVVFTGADQARQELIRRRLLPTNGRPADTMSG